MHNTVRIGIAITLLGLSACSQNMTMDGAAAIEPVVIEEPATLERKSDCVTTDMDDGIGGTGCPVIVE